VGTVRALTHPQHLPAPARLWTHDEWEAIRHGHLSRSEHDRWNAFVENGRLFLHRKGSGVGIYEVQFTPANDGTDSWVVTELVLNGDPSVHVVDSPQVHALHAEALIDSLLLRLADSRAIQALSLAPAEPVPA
jgi:hypothetical protein